jgi:diguanylate cyclase (GGDEF)-like protein
LAIFRNFWSEILRMSETEGGGQGPVSRRIELNLRNYDVKGERAIAIAQAAISCFVLTLHTLAGTRADLSISDSWMVLALGLLIASSGVRWYLTYRDELPERALDLLNVVDVAIILSLIWGYQYVYDHPAGGSLQAPSFALLIVLIGLRALRFHPRPILTVGLAAIIGWALLVCCAVWVDGVGAITNDYRNYLGSFQILPGAEIERIVAMTSLVVFLAIATYAARQMLSRAAHADDYSDALIAAERHLAEATKAKEAAEAALSELDRRDKELSEQNLRFNAALANMPIGLCMFDEEQRLLVCNDRYLDMYGIPKELAAPGTHFRQIIDARVAKGVSIAGEPANYLEERLSAVRATEMTTKVHELNDGRSVAITHTPMAQGGWVATHEDITQIREIETRMSHMARHDALTDLPNRNYLRVQMQQLLEKNASSGKELIVILFNIDRFKEVNDSLGPSLGDALLQGVAARMRRWLKGIDVLARVGGDDFVVIKSTDKAAVTAAALVRKIQGAIGTSFDLDDHQVVVSASLGIAIGPADGNDPDQLLKNADLALNRAKDHAPGTARFFEGAMDEQMQARHKLERDLRQALRNQEFEVYYQPQLNLESGKVTGFEALLRWNHPERGLVGPNDFIPLAEETGLIVPIGEWVLRRACVEVATWPKGLKVAVNLSAAQFRFGNVRQAVISALGSAQVVPQRLEIEVTESVLLQDNETVCETLDKLEEMGVSVALDDFGTGYSSLGYLKRFRFNKIKIDRSFVNEIVQEDNSSLAILRSVIALAKSLGIQTTAEGVETREQLERVRAEGCTEAQGYYISEPRPAQYIPDMLAHGKRLPKSVSRRAS